MRYPVEEVLASLAKLGDDKPAVHSRRNCKMCGGNSHHLDYVDFNRTCNGYNFGRSGIQIEYFRCDSCEFAFTDFFDDWTTNDFARFIYNEEYVKADPDYTGIRPANMAEQFSEIFKEHDNLKGLDYGGGAGVFAKAVTEMGTEFSLYDPFSQPDRPEGQFDIVTAFEVIEHSPNPVQTLDDIFHFMKPDGCVIISQTLQPSDIETIGRRWWYMAPRNGHVSFYSDITLQRYCEPRGLIYSRMHGNLIFHRNQPSAAVRAIKDRMGAATHRLVVGSPARGYSAGHWHDIESHEGTDFRWTAKQESELGVFPLYAGITVIEIPIVGWAKPEILHSPQIMIDKIAYKAYISDGKITTAFMNDRPGHRTIALKTSPLQSPKEIGINDDERQVGLAVISSEFLSGQRRC